MRASIHGESQKRAAAVLALVVIFVFPQHAAAWGRNGQKLVASRAIETLPPEIRGFFEMNQAFLLQHVTDPFDTLSKTPSEKRNNHLFLDKYGRFPFNALPRSYKEAVTKFGKSKLESNGLLPWQIGVYNQKLTEDMKTGHWDDARFDAAILAHYVALSHDPFSTTDNFDGKLTGQVGVNERFGTALIDRYSSFFPVRPNDAVYIHDPTDHAFESCITSHSWIETILVADRNAYLGENAYNDEYFDRFYNQAAATLIRQLSEAASDVASYWLTAWVNAGKPPLPH